MKNYNIQIDYLENSNDNKTAKISVTDEKGDFILKKAPISLPDEFFGKNSSHYYFGINETPMKISHVDFIGNAARNSNEKFTDLSGFVQTDKKGEREFFDQTNSDYIVFKRNILFFPQKDLYPLGVDKTAFIMHNSDYKKLTSAIGDEEVQFSFAAVKRNFSLFDRFEGRNVSRKSKINAAYNTIKNALLSRRSTGQVKENPATSIIQGLVTKKIAERRRNQKNKADIVDNAPKDSGSSEVETNKKNDIVSSLIGEEKSTPNTSDPGHHNIPYFDSQRAEINASSDNTHFFIGNSRDNNSIVDYFNRIEKMKDGSLNRSIDPFFITNLHAYFQATGADFNERNIKEVARKVPGGNGIQNISFLSNENGFFAQLFADDQKQSPLAVLSFDFESKELLVKNEESSISLRPGEMNGTLDYFAKYRDFDLSGKVASQMINKDNIEQSTLSCFNLEVLDKNGESRGIFNFAAVGSFVAKDDSVYHLDSFVNEKIDHFTVEEVAKNGILNNNSLSLNVNFEGKNEAQFNANKYDIGKTITPESMDEAISSLNMNNDEEVSPESVEHSDPEIKSSEVEMVVETQTIEPKHKDVHVQPEIAEPVFPVEPTLTQKNESEDKVNTQNNIIETAPVEKEEYIAPTDKSNILYDDVYRWAISNDALKIEREELKKIPIEKNSDGVDYIINDPMRVGPRAPFEPTVDDLEFYEGVIPNFPKKLALNEDNDLNSPFPSTHEPKLERMDKYYDYSSSYNIPSLIKKGIDKLNTEEMRALEYRFIMIPKYYNENEFERYNMLYEAKKDEFIAMIEYKKIMEKKNEESAKLENNDPVISEPEKNTTVEENNGVEIEPQSLPSSLEHTTSSEESLPSSSNDHQAQWGDIPFSESEMSSMMNDENMQVEHLGYEDYANFHQEDEGNDMAAQFAYFDQVNNAPNVADFSIHDQQSYERSFPEKDHHFDHSLQDAPAIPENSQSTNEVSKNKNKQYNRHKM